MAYKTCLREWVGLALGLLLLVACAPAVETAATVPVARPTASIPTTEVVASQPTSLPASIAAPTTSTAISTPTATSISTEDVQGTHTAIYATEAAEAATHFAPTPTFTPSPTFTPVPGPVWPIFFRAIPCQGRSTCDDSLGMDYSFASYVINSDGSQLTPTTDLGFPDDFSHPVFSADGTRLAYRAKLEPEGLWHLFLANADGSEAVDLGAGDFFDYQFIAEADCLIGARFVSRAVEGMNLAIEKRCIGQTQPQELEALTFPVFYEIHFSPQGDALLAYGEDSNHETQLLVYEIEGDTQLIYSSGSGNENFTGAARWLPDGEKIEFITGLFVPDNPITTTFNLIEQDGTGLEVRLNVAADFAIAYGTWSPDGQEFAFSNWNFGPPEESGLYIVDLSTGEWRQILSHFFLGSPGQIDVWKQDADEASE